MILLTAIGTGLGLWLIAVGLFPRPLRLDKALAALNPPTEPDAPLPDEALGWTARMGTRAARHLRPPRGAPPAPPHPTLPGPPPRRLPTESPQGRKAGRGAPRRAGRRHRRGPVA